MNVLITGGCGFQGSHLAEALAKKGDYIVIVNTVSEHAKENAEYLRRYKNIQIGWGSILDREFLDSAMKGVERVYHLGARINVDESIRRPMDYVETNYQGTQNVLEEAMKHKTQMLMASSCEVYGENVFGVMNVLESVRKFKPDLQFISTAAVYGEGSSYKMNEWHPLRPASPYAASKAAADRLCYSYYKTYDLDIKIVRPFNIYGERQKRQGFGAVIPIFFEKALSHQPLTVYGDGSQTRDYLHVSDIVRAYQLIAETKELRGKAVNVGSGIERRVIDIANEVLEVTGQGEGADFMVNDKHSKVEFIGARSGEVNSFVADNSLIEQFGFKPEVEFKVGMKRYHEWRLAQIQREYDKNVKILKNIAQTPPLVERN